MRDYEVVYIFRPALSPEEVQQKLEAYHALLARDGGEVTAVEHWGKRQLAYPIRKETSGYYVVAQFKAEPEVLAELESALKLDEGLLRYLVVLSEGELTAPSSLPGRSGQAEGGPKAAGEARGDGKEEERDEETEEAEEETDEEDE